MDANRDKPDRAGLIVALAMGLTAVVMVITIREPVTTPDTVDAAASRVQPGTKGDVRATSVPQDMPRARADAAALPGLADKHGATAEALAPTAPVPQAAGPERYSSLADVRARNLEPATVLPPAVSLPAPEAERKPVSDQAIRVVDLSAGPSEVHAVAIYQSAIPTGLRSGRPVGEVRIHMTVTQHPVTLLLTAYEPIDWKIEIAPGANLHKVITEGYHSQRVIGVPSDTPVATRSNEERTGGYVAYGRNREDVLIFLERARVLTGKVPMTFQAGYSAGSFIVDGTNTIAFDTAGQRARRTDPSASSIQPPAVSVQSARRTDPPTLGAVSFVEGRRYPGGKLSADSLTVTYCCAGAFSITMASAAIKSGKHYWEMKLSTRDASYPGTWTNAGLIPAYPDGNEAALTMSESPHGVMKGRDKKQMKDGDVFGFALDLDRGRYFYHVNGEWIVGPPDGNPGIKANANQAYVAAVTIAAPESNAPKSTDAWTANFGATPFRYPIPRGYRSYDGKQGS